MLFFVPHVLKADVLASNICMFARMFCCKPPPHRLLYVFVLDAHLPSCGRWTKTESYKHRGAERPVVRTWNVAVPEACRLGGHGDSPKQFSGVLFVFLGSSRGGLRWFFFRMFWVLEVQKTLRKSEAALGTYFGPCAELLARCPGGLGVLFGRS